MNPACQRFEPDWELASLGSLEASELAEMEEHLRTGCPLCLSRFQDAQVAMSGFASLSPVEQPSAGVESRLRSRIFSGASRPRPRPAILPWLLAAASAVIAAWLGWDRHLLLRQVAQKEAPPPPPVVSLAPPPSVVIPQTKLPEAVAGPVPAVPPREQIPPALTAELERLRRTVEELSASKVDAVPAEVERLRARVSELEKERLEAAARPPAASAPPVSANPASEAELALLRQQLARQATEAQVYARQLGELRGLLRLLQSSSLRQIELRASDAAAKGASGHALVTGEGAVVLFMQRLPPLTASKCYQLWLIKKGNPSIVSGGILQTDSQGNGMLIGSGAGQLTGLAITEEPAGGSVSAQGHKLLFGML